MQAVTKHDPRRNTSFSRFVAYKWALSRPPPWSHNVPSTIELDEAPKSVQRAETRSRRLHGVRNAMNIISEDQWYGYNRQQLQGRSRDFISEWARRSEIEEFLKLILYYLGHKFPLYLTSLCWIWAVRYQHTGQTTNKLYVPCIEKKGTEIFM